MRNRFNYAAILEVAVVFLGIFICMQPALQLLEAWGPHLKIDSPPKFFWVTGGLSAVLDNAPTYLVFFKTAQTLTTTGTTQAGVAVEHLTAISLGAVFMGAMTYIGNGPNFMVKAIAEESGVKMPGFFGFMAYSLCVLLRFSWRCNYYSCDATIRPDPRPTAVRRHPGFYRFALAGVLGLRPPE